MIEEFSYLSGATPVPCIRCNERVKFKDLLETAKDLDADCMATGHYIQRKIGPPRGGLHRAADANRDQSYFLFSTTADQLDFLRFLSGIFRQKTIPANSGSIRVARGGQTCGWMVFVPMAITRALSKNFTLVQEKQVTSLMEMALCLARITA